MRGNLSYCKKTFLLSVHTQEDRYKIIQSHINHNVEFGIESITIVNNVCVLYYNSL